MGKVPSFEDYLPKTPISIEFSEFHCPVYTDAHEAGFIFGTEEKARVRKIKPSDKRLLFPIIKDDLLKHYTDQEVRIDTIPPSVFRGCYYRNYVRSDKNKSDSLISKGQILLVDMLDAGQQILSYTIEGRTKKSYEESINHIMSLCSKYGLLMTQDTEFTRLNQDRGMLWNWINSWNNDCLYYCFDALAASEVLETLYTLYLSWKALYWGISELEKEQLHYKLSNSFLASPNKEFTKENYQECISRVSMTANMRRIIAYFKEDKPTVITNYDTALDAAIGSMLNIIAMGEDALEQRRSAICSRCGAEFIQYHGRQKYCDICKDNTIQVREYRARKKTEREAQQHAQESK